MVIPLILKALEIQQADERRLEVSGFTYVQSGDLNDFGLVDLIPEEDQQDIHTLIHDQHDSALDRAVGALVGCAIGDAVGAPLEFIPATDTPNPDFSFSSSTMSYRAQYNKFELKRGQWTDDASMALCIADSLIICDGFDGSDVRARFHGWWTRGYNNAFRFDDTRSTSVGLGGNIMQSLAALKPGETPPPVFERENEDAGIGSVMRVSPISIFYHRDIDASMEYARASSYTTHPGPLAAEACAFLSFAISRAIAAHSCLDLNKEVKMSREASGAGNRGVGLNAQSFLEETVAEYIAKIQHMRESIDLDPRIVAALESMTRLLRSQEPADSTERCWNWRYDNLEIEATMNRRYPEYNGYPVSPGYFGSFCMDGLAMALWAVYHSTNFGEAIEKCVNLLGDADSTAAVAGQLAGAIYGYSKIDQRFIKNMNQWDKGSIAVRGALLYFGKSTERLNAGQDEENKELDALRGHHLQEKTADRE